VLYAGLLLAGIDIAVHRLPNSIIAGTTVGITSIISTAAALAHQPQLLVTAVGSGILLGGEYLLLALLAGSGMGMGDVRLAALRGLTLGTRGSTAVLLGGLLPYLLAAPAALTRLCRGRPDRIPFGPFLVGGTVVAALLVA
jgi:leader peptidase (prepilin peptidase)/N-methyltransferase